MLMCTTRNCSVYNDISLSLYCTLQFAVSHDAHNMPHYMVAVTRCSQLPRSPPLDPSSLLLSALATRRPTFSRSTVALVAC